MSDEHDQLIKRIRELQKELRIWRLIALVSGFTSGWMLAELIKPLIGL